MLLGETGADFEVTQVDLKAAEQRSPEYLAQNPKGKVPALMRSDGSVLTEFPAIAFWLAQEFPDAGLIGAGSEAQARALELVDFIVSSLHMRAFTLMKVPQKFSADLTVQKAIADYGRTEAQSGLALLSDRLADQEFFLGQFGIADVAAWYVLNWAQVEAVEVPENLDRFWQRIEQRRSRGERIA